ncbi:MAG: signal peptidase II, partial [Pseudomonadota bacterium]
LLVTFVLDQATKWVVLEVIGLRAVGDAVTVLPILDFVLVLNHGINFGLFASGSESQAVVLAIVKIVAAAGAVIWAARTWDVLLAAGCGLLAGGALGNALDRLTVGAVVDFINFDCCGIGNPYAFNIADAAIFLGALAIIWRAGRDAPADAR